VRVLIASCLLALLAGCDHPSSDAGRGDPGAAPRSAPRQGTLQIVSLNRLQGLGDPIPCQPGDIGVLPAAAELRDRLAATGDTALLVAIGDACNRSHKPLHGKPAETANLARCEVELDALAACRPDAYVPGHADLATGFDALLARCEKRGLPVLLSNIAAPAHAGIRPWIVVQAGTLKIGLLGIIAARVGDPKEPEVEAGQKPEPMEVSYPGASMLPVDETVTRLVGELRGAQGVDLVVLLSSLSQKANSHLADIKGLDVVIGSADVGFEADRIVLDQVTAFMSAAPAGREVGHTTIAIRNGNMQMADMSPTHALVEQIATVEERMAEYSQRFGTDDPATLSRLVAPGAEQGFLNMVALLAENKEFLKVHESWKDSYIDHRPAELEPVDPGHPALAIMAGQGAAIEAALAAASFRPLVVPEGTPLIPKPEDCRACHAAQYDFWAATPHSRAFEDLRGEQQIHDVSCLECHAAGFEKPNGWSDPRFDGPFGGVTCFQCHDVYAPHSVSARQVVDPQFVHADSEQMDCTACHIPRRDPEFDKDVSLPAVTCPPMRADEPALLLARQGVLDALAARGAKGVTDPRDDYLQGRALVGLGSFEQGYAVLERYAKANPEDTHLRVETAQLFDRTGNSKGALQLLRDYLQTHAGEPVSNLAYITMLLQARDVAVRDPQLALSQITFLLPKDALESRKIALDFRVLQVDAYFAAGQPDKGLALINELARDHSGDPRLRQRIARYLGQ